MLHEKISFEEGFDVGHESAERNIRKENGGDD
jgi:hypothetical protein